MISWNRISPIKVLLMALVMTTLTAGVATASVWCGENGVVRFSFAEGEELVEVFDAGEPVNGVTTVDIYAWLSDVDLVAEDGEKFLRVGGFELQLTIEGAEGFILKQEFPTQALNVGRKVGSIAAGMVPGQRLKDGFGDKDRLGFGSQQVQQVPVGSRHTGPAVGEQLPDIVAPDFRGQMVDVHEARRGGPLVMTFYRSAVW